MPNEGTHSERPTARSRPGRRAWRVGAAAALMLLAAAVTLSAGALLLVSVNPSWSGPETTLRAALIVVALLATVLGLAATASAVLGMRAEDGRLRPLRTLNLIAGTVSLFVLWVILVTAATDALVG